MHAKKCSRVTLAWESISRVTPALKRGKSRTVGGQDGEEREEVEIKLKVTVG